MGENISANDFCRYIWKSYLEDRRYDLVNEFVSDKISVIGTGAHENSLPSLQKRAMNGPDIL